MSTPLPDRAVRGTRHSSANDRFKARWNDRLGWSILAAVAAHVILLLWSPRLDFTDRLLDFSGDGLQVEWLALLDGLSGSGGQATAIVAVSEGEGDEEPEESVEPADPGDGSEPATEPGLDGAGEGLLDLLRRRGAPRPTIVEPAPEPEAEDSEAVQTERVAVHEDTPARIGGDASTPDFAGMEGALDVDLDRLSAIRPELALLSPSSWILILNPADVVDFLTRRFRAGDLVNSPGGMVSVAMWIDERGSVEWAEINRSSGRRDVDETALQLFNEVIAFRPARERGVRVPIAVIFHLTYPW